MANFICLDCRKRVVSNYEQGLVFLLPPECKTPDECSYDIRWGMKWGRRVWLVWKAIKGAFGRS